MRVELVCVGDELLLGDVVNGNAAWLGQRLAEDGLRVTRSVTVGDDVDAIATAIDAGLRQAEVVLVTGGLGPTSDDLTRDALARVAGVGVRRDPEVLRSLRGRVAAQGLQLRDNALRMADVPEGAVLLANPRGSAPGLRMTLADGTAYALPGVPAEMRAMMTETVLPELRVPGQEAGAEPGTLVRTLHTAVVRETTLAARLAPVEELPGVRLAYLPSPGEIRVRVTAGADADDDPGPGAESRLAAAVDQAEQLLGATVYGKDGDELDRVVHGLLGDAGATVAVAESLTGGMLGAALTRMPGSSATFRGGVTAYATELKTELLGVPEHVLARHGAVHPEVATAMALAVRQRLGSTHGVGLTGVAGPESQDGQPVGTVYIAVAGPTGEPLVDAPTLVGERALIRRLAVVHAVDLLRRRLLGVGSFREWATREDQEQI